MSDFDTSEVVNEEELASLDLKKKDDALIDIDDPEAEPVVDTEVAEEEKEDADRGFFLEDKEYEQQLLDPYGDNGTYDM